MVTAKNRAISVILIITLVIGMVGIVSTDTTYAAKKKIHLKKTKVTLTVGKKYTQKLYSKKGKLIKAKKVKWRSLKPSVAKINKYGKITARKAGTAKMTAKYKGKTYKFTVKVKKKKDNKNYTTADVINLLDYVGNAQDYGNELIDDVEYWGYDSYKSYSKYVDYIQADAGNAIPYLKKAKAITAAKHTRNCNSEQAADAGFTTWDGMIGSLITQCNSVKNADVESMSDYERMSFAQKALRLSIAINSAYIEIYDYEKNK